LFKKNSRLILLVLTFCIFITLFLTLTGNYPLAVSSSFDLNSIKTQDGLLQINENVFVNNESKYNVNMTLIVSGKQAAIIDTGYGKEEVQRVKNYIEKNSLEVELIVITHNHFDHKANIELLKSDNTKVYDYANTEDGQVIKLGDKSLRIIDTPGHDGDRHISVELMDYNMLAAGDIVSSSEPPAIMSPDIFMTYKATLEKIFNNKYTLIIPGHGPLVNTASMKERSLNYLNNTEKIVAAYLKKGTSSAEITKVSLEQCAKEYKEYTASHSQTLHRNNLLNIYLALRSEQKTK